MAIRSGSDTVHLFRNGLVLECSRPWHGPCLWDRGAAAMEDVREHETLRLTGKDAELLERQEENLKDLCGSVA